MSSESLEVLCKHCGQTLTDFLRKMQAHNAKVVCPACGKAHEHVSTHETGVLHNDGLARSSGGTAKESTRRVPPSSRKT